MKKPTDNIGRYLDRSILKKQRDSLVADEQVINLFLQGLSITEIAEFTAIPASKIRRLRTKHFPELPISTRDGSATKNKEKQQKDRYRELNQRDRRIMRMLKTQTYAEVAEKNSVSVGTVHNLAQFYSDQLTERKVKRKSAKLTTDENE